MAPSRTADPARYRAEATTPDGLIVYRTDDRDDLIAVERRHTAAGVPLAMAAWDDTDGVYTAMEAAA